MPPDTASNMSKSVINSTCTTLYLSKEDGRNEQACCYGIITLDAPVKSLAKGTVISCI